MNAVKKEITYKSSNEKNNIFATIYLPYDNNIKIAGILQIAHGMSEHKQRYEDFANYMTSNGYIVCINDHSGHGKSAPTKAHYGYIANEKGYKVLVNDVYKLTQIMKKRYPNMKYYLLGHSMGSFVARVYAYKYSNELDKVIFMGTGQKAPLTDMAIKIVDINILIRGAKAKGDNINKLAFGAFNNKFKPNRTVFDWLSRDEAQVDKYISDEKCGFVFTLSGYKDLFKVLKQANSRKCFNGICSSLPILLISGEDDPVGNFGRGVTKVYNSFRKCGKNAELKLYPSARHEILNEINNKEVYEFIKNWLR